ncbi:hypothetical protein GCM10007386_43120 [Pseudoduganella dura]|nr:hypothetical protein GCM10007386_43120 [Pseudoduganella dura]
MGYQVRTGQRHADRNDAAHRLRDKRRRRIHSGNDLADQVVETVYIALRRNRTESGPSDVDFFRTVTNEFGNRYPKIHPPEGAGKEKQF